MSQDNIYTRITVQKAIELDTITPLSAGQYPKFVVNLSKSILGVTSEELGEAVNKTEAAANKAATAEKNAKASEINAKASETSASSSKAAALTSQNAAKASETNAKNSENAAKVSQTAAKTSETNSKNSENAAKTSQTAAAASQNAAKGSADAAKTSQTAAAASQNAAKTSETNSKKSEEASAASQVAAKASETAAAGSQVAAKSSETAAKASQSAAKASEDATKVSETNAKASADNSKASQADAKVSADAAKISQNAAKASETNSKNSENAAKASQAAAASSQSAAKTSENNAKASADAAKAVEVIASGTQEAIKTSEANAKAAAEAAKASQTSASASQSAAKASENAAKASQTAAASSQSAAKTSETNAKNSENAAKASQTAAASSQSAAKTSETNAKASEVSAKTSETNTMNALSKYIKIGTGGANPAFRYSEGHHGYFEWWEGASRQALVGYAGNGRTSFEIRNEKSNGNVDLITKGTGTVKANGVDLVKQGDDGFHGTPSTLRISSEDEFLVNARNLRSTMIFRNDNAGVIPGINRYAPSLLIKSGDTWGNLSIDHSSGRLSTRGGNRNGSSTSSPRSYPFTDEVWTRGQATENYLRTPNSKAAIGVEQWKVGKTAQYAKWLKIATIGGVDASAQGSRYSFELNSIVDGYGTDAIQSIGTLVVTIASGASAKNISAKLFRTYKTANDSRIRVKQLGRYRAELWIRVGGYGSVQASCLSMDKYEPASNVLADDIPIGGTGDLLTYDASVSEIYNSDNISEIVSRITTNKQTIKSELGAPKFSLVDTVGGDNGGLVGTVDGGSWASWTTRPAMLDVKSNKDNGSSSIWKLRSPTGESIASFGGFSTNGSATGAALQLRWGNQGITYNPSSMAATCDIVTDKLFRGNQLVLSGDGGVRTYFVSSSDNSNYFAFHNRGGTDISSRTAFVGFGSNDTTSFTIKNEKTNKYLAIGNTLTFNGTQVLDKNNITQTFGVQTDLVPSVKIVKDGLDNRYSKSESDARFVNTNETNLGKNATALTTIPSGGWSKPIGYSVMVNQASTGKPPNTTNHGYWHVIAARDTAGGYAGFYADYAGGRVFYGQAQAKTDNPSWYKVYTEASKPTPAEIGAYTKAESDGRFSPNSHFTKRSDIETQQWDGQKRQYFFMNNAQNQATSGVYRTAGDAYIWGFDDSGTMRHGLIPIGNGGTGAKDVATARNNLQVYSKAETYSRGEVDSRVNVKANSADVWQKGQTYSRAESYSRSEVDSRVNVKANSADVYKKGETYSRSEVDSRVNVKANSADVYAKSSVYQKTETYNRGEIDSRIVGQALKSGIIDLPKVIASGGNQITTLRTSQKTIQCPTVPYPSIVVIECVLVDESTGIVADRVPYDIRMEVSTTGGEILYNRADTPNIFSKLAKSDRPGEYGIPEYSKNTTRHTIRLRIPANTPASIVINGHSRYDKYIVPKFWYSGHATRTPEGGIIV